MKLYKTYKHREDLYGTFEACARSVKARLKGSCGKEGRFWGAKS